MEFHANQISEMYSDEVGKAMFSLYSDDKIMREQDKGVNFMAILWHESKATGSGIFQMRLSVFHWLVIT